MSEGIPVRDDVQALVDLIAASARTIAAGRPMTAGPANASWMECDLTLAQLRFLRLLAEQGPLTISQVASQLGVALTTASQFVDRLEGPGYVERVHRSDDRRVVECRLTDRGRELIASMHGMQREALTRLISLLEPDELHDLERLFRVMVERLTTTRAGAGTAEAASTGPTSTGAATAEAASTGPASAEAASAGPTVDKVSGGTTAGTGATGDEASGTETPATTPGSGR